MFFLRTFCSPLLRNSLNGRQHFSSLKEDSALELLKKYDSPVMEYYTIRKVEEAKIAASKIIDNPSNISGGGVIKALVASGGRALGKFKDGGCDSGIKMFKTAEEAEEIAQKMLGYRLVTKQTGPEGLLCEKLMLVPEIKHSKTIYAAFSIDRTSETGITLIGSAEGGINIEHTAEHSPDTIIKLPVNASGDDLDEKCEIFIDRLTFLPNKSKQELGVALKKLFQAFKQSDCTLAEVNPIFLEDGSGRIIFGDSKVAVDSNAMFRQDFVQKLLNESSTGGKKEQEESFNYVKLDGNIGCLVNGAGLAMATLDQIINVGLKPANFLDIGGGSNPESISSAMDVILADKSVDRIFINIFGGIVSCENIMNALNDCLTNRRGKNEKEIPIVARFFGNGSEKARDLSINSDVPLTIENDLSTAIEKLKKIK